MEGRIESGTVVGTIECPSCQAQVDVKVNIKGGLCAICTNVIDPEAAGNKKYCWHRVTYSRHAVSKIIKSYQEGMSNVRNEDQQPEYTERGNGEPEADAKPDGGGAERHEPATENRGFFSRIFADDDGEALY